MPDLDRLRGNLDVVNSVEDERAVQAASLLYVLFVGASILLGLLLPDSAESYPHAMTTLADFVAAAVPSIRGFVSVSSFPVVTKVFLAVQWLMVPVLAVLISMNPNVVKPNQKTLHRFSRFKLCLLLIAALALFVVYPAIMDVQPEDLVGGLAHERALARAAESRLWMSLFGSSVIFLVAYSIALLISYGRVLFFEPRSQRQW